MQTNLASNFCHYRARRAECWRGFVCEHKTVPLLWGHWICKELKQKQRPAPLAAEITKPQYLHRQYYLQSMVLVTTSSLPQFVFVGGTGAEVLNMVQAHQQPRFAGTIYCWHEAGGFTLQALSLIIRKQLKRHPLRVSHSLQECYIKV